MAISRELIAIVRPKLSRQTIVAASSVTCISKCGRLSDPAFVSSDRPSGTVALAVQQRIGKHEAEVYTLSRLLCRKAMLSSKILDFILLPASNALKVLIPTGELIFRLRVLRLLLEFLVARQTIAM